MVAFEAEPFLPPRSLRFRGVTDTLAGYHLEGSECCLIHYDNGKARGSKGVWVNPNVRVAYRAKGWDLVNGPGGWPGTWELVRGWGIRFSTYALGLPWRNRKVEMKVREWGGTEPGIDCLVDEMQILADNGWKHM